MKYLIGLLIFSCVGCATIVAREQGKIDVFSKTGVYPATRLDFDILDPDAIKLHPGWSFVIVPLVIIDLPFSFTFDTLLFPYEYYKSTLSVCNNYDNEDQLQRSIFKTTKGINAKNITIIQMHQKHEGIFVEYKFDSSSEKYVSLFMHEGNTFRQGPFLIHSDNNDSKDLVRKYFFERTKKDYQNLIDCYK